MHREATAQVEGEAELSGYSSDWAPGRSQAVAVREAPPSPFSLGAWTQPWAEGALHASRRRRAKQLKTAHQRDAGPSEGHWGRS